MAEIPYIRNNGKENTIGEVRGLVQHPVFCPLLHLFHLYASDQGRVYESRGRKHATTTNRDQMSWKDQAKAAQLAIQAREGQKSYGYGSYGSYGYRGGYNQIQNPLISILGQKIEGRDPRTKLPSYRAIEHALSIVQLAISVHERFIGVPEIVKGKKGNPRAVKVLQDFWANTPIYGQTINPLASDKGLEAFVPQMIQSVMRDGSQFYRLMQQPSTSRVNKSPIEGIRLFDSQLFEYIPDPTDLERALLSYASPNGQVYATPELGYNELHFFKSPEYLWGLPLAYGAEFFAERFVRFIISYVNGAIRSGDPIGITLIGFKAPPRGTMVNVKEYEAEQRLMVESTQQIKDVHREAIQKQKTTNQSQDEIIILPGDVSMLSNYYGSGIPTIPNFPQAAEQLVTELGRSLKTPMSFLGINQGNAGLGSDIFKIQKDSLVLATDLERSQIEKNCIRVINSRVLQSYGIIDTPDAYALEWKQPDLTDEKLEAETDKLNAEAVAQQLLNITAIFTELSGSDPTKAVNAYMDEIERPEWKILQPSPEPIEPIPDV